MAGFFIAGTDTGAGKTVITAALVRQMRMQGINAAPMKVVQTGGGYSASGLPISSDFEFYCQASTFLKDQKDVKDMVPYSFSAPSSPHLAAAIENRTCTVQKIYSAFKRLDKKYELIIAEGVGGINVPLSTEVTTTALIKRMRLPVIIAIRNCLGCINHTLNTIDVLRYHRIPIYGAILTQTSESVENDHYLLDDNPNIISRLGTIKILGSIPYIPHPSSSTIFWETIDPHMQRIVTQIAAGLINGK